MTQVLWTPSEQTINASNLQAFRQAAQLKTGQSFPDYQHLYDWSISDRVSFWELVADFFQVMFHRQPQAVLANDVMPGARWFPDSTLNYAEHLLQHRESDEPAIIFRGEKGQRQSLSWQKLYQEVAAAQSGLVQKGIKKGDRVAAFMPNCPETIIMMLATTALGAIWSSCSPDFGFQGVLDRFGQIEPKLLLACDGYFYGGKTIDCKDKVAAIQQAIPSLQQTVLVPFMEPGLSLSESPLTSTLLYSDFTAQASHAIHFEPVAFNDPLFIMYSSGTTGVPKCIVHGHGGTLLQHLKELALHTDLKSTDTFFYFTTCGWMMWNWMVSALALGTTLVIYDGSPFSPGPSALVDLLEEEQVSVFGTSAKYIAALEKAGVKPDETHDLKHLKAILSTGSPLLHESFDYVYRSVKNDLCLSSISGGTDIVSCFALGNPVLPVIRGELQCRGLGMDVQFVNDDGEPRSEEKGELTCQSSFPCMPVGFWNDEDGSRYQNAYFNRFPGVWAHGDYGELRQSGGVVIHGRADAILNPGGVRIGTAEIYRQVEKVEAVLESIAIGQEWENDVRVVLFVKLRPGVSLSNELTKEIKDTVRQNTTPRHVPAVILQVEDIPRTISGKIVELAVRDIVHGKHVENTEALANPEALEYFRDRVELK
ncbi:acetoacetyl-CoA synthetase [Endozoicomonas montiporae]|uniref:Acetoacetyl-CoA synthetase n=2 Tax=Endozoicomonas montiporae TaxID=1027273 RepID=A0A081N877_9GAMM|nr:acetoacetate--CoA ligase [Endozoicomonas montiporae]AMO55462.1 acetoacetyl-CoA synthetase [Endozoicomonas montiporae CL-33]KEQ14650.1 acetoacetyl-CoA synthetase [Endozoicomonas montiporae]